MSSALLTLRLLAALPPPCLLTGLDDGLLVDELPELKLGMDGSLAEMEFLLTNL